MKSFFVLLLLVGVCFCDPQFNRVEQLQNVERKTFLLTNINGTQVKIFLEQDNDDFDFSAKVPEFENTENDVVYLKADDIQIGVMSASEYFKNWIENTQQHCRQRGKYYESRAEPHEGEVSTYTTTIEGSVLKLVESPDDDGSETTNMFELLDDNTFKWQIIMQSEGQDILKTTQYYKILEDVTLTKLTKPGDVFHLVFQQNLYDNKFVANTVRNDKNITKTRINKRLSKQDIKRLTDKYVKGDKVLINYIIPIPKM